VRVKVGESTRDAECQLESVEEVKNMGEIIAVDGVDCIHIELHPCDLSASHQTQLKTFSHPPRLRPHTREGLLLRH
jgi:2-keto-3-deoxy-L-rhamnonate aldolase RhmA